MSKVLGAFLQSHIARVMRSYMNPTASSPLDRYLREYFLNNKSIGSKDRHTISDQVYCLVRYQTLLHYLLKGQVNYHDQLKLLYTSDFFGAMENQRLPKYIRASFPKILFQKITHSFNGDEEIAFEVCRALNNKAQITLRVNPLKSNRKKILNMLRNYLKLEAVETSISPYGIKLLSRPSGSLYLTKQFLEGQFQVQDQGSQIAGDLVKCRPGELVLDFCAGSGGKSLTIAHKLQNKGQIFLHDVRENAILKGKKRFEKAGSTNVQFHNNQQNLKAIQGKIDWVIADVPCTGTGTIRRNPDIKLRFSEDWLKENVILQQAIMNRCLKYIKKRGKIVYITCSMLKQENQQQIQKFIKLYQLRVADNQMLKIKPTKDGMDSLFAVVLEKDI